MVNGKYQGFFLKRFSYCFGVKQYEILIFLTFYKSNMEYGADMMPFIAGIDSDTKLMTAFGSLQTVVEHFLSQQKIVVAFSV
jgi:hypothetical protein